MVGLSKSQKLVYDMEKYAGGRIATICGSLLIEGSRDETLLKKAVNDLYRLNSALRTRISEGSEGTFQEEVPYSERDIAVMQFNSKNELDKYAVEYVNVPISIYGDLCEINVILLPGRFGFLVKLHHIIADAWSLTLLCSQFISLLKGKTPHAFSYLEHINSEERYIHSEMYATDKEYFLTEYKKCDDITLLSEKQDHSFSTKRKTFIIDRSQAESIKQYAAQSSASPYSVFLTALSAYFSRIKMNAEKFYIGTAILNRSGIHERNTVGMFVNTAPILIELDSNGSFRENLDTIKAKSFGVFRHQRFNYNDVLSAIRSECGYDGKLYDVVLSYQNATVIGENVETTWYPSGAQIESLQVHIDDRDSDGIYHIQYDYRTDKFSEAEIGSMHRHIINLLFDAIRDDTKPIYSLEMLSADEKHKLLYEFNDTAIDYPKDKCVHQLFEEQAMRTPDKVAVIACDKTLTYRELNELANQIAHSLFERGVKPGDIVAFKLPRRSYLIASMLGILKVGAAYMPIDPDYPEDRISYMIEDSKAIFLITDNNISDLINLNIPYSNLELKVNLYFSVKNFIPLENTGVSSVFATSVWPFSLIFSLARRNEGNFFQAVPTTLSSSLAEVRLASLVAWA